MLQNKILRSPDPLDFNINDVDTARPRVPAAVYEFQVDKARVEQNKAKNGELLILDLKPTQPLQATSGETIQSFALIHRISLTPTENYPVDSIKRNLASFFKAAGVAGSA